MNSVPIIAAAVMLLIVGLTVGFARAARSIRREHKARFSRIQRRIEEDANALVDRVLRRDL